MRKLILIVLFFTLTTPQPTYALRPMASSASVKVPIQKKPLTEDLGNLERLCLDTNAVVRDIIELIKSIEDLDDFDLYVMNKDSRIVHMSFDIALFHLTVSYLTGLRDMLNRFKQTQTPNEFIKVYGWVQEQYNLAIRKALDILILLEETDYSELPKPEYAGTMGDPIPYQGVLYAFLYNALIERDGAEERMRNYKRLLRGFKTERDRLVDCMDTLVKHINEQKLIEKCGLLQKLHTAFAEAA